MKTKIQLLMMAALALAPAQAWSQENAPAKKPEYSNFSVGVGGGGEYNTHAGASATSSAHLSFFRMAEGTRENPDTYKTEGVPSHVQETSLQYNMIGASNDGVTTGIQAHIRSGLFVTTKSEFQNGCGYYIGVTAGVDGAVAYQNAGANGFTALIGPETGLWCQIANKAVLTFSPTVSVGASAYLKNMAAHPSALTGPIVMGGRARLMLDDKFYASLEGLHMPSVVSKDDPARARWTNGQLRFIAEYKIDKDWSVDAHVTYQNFTDERDSSVALPTFNRIEGGGTLKKVF